MSSKDHMFLKKDIKEQLLVRQDEADMDDVTPSKKDKDDLDEASKISVLVASTKYSWKNFNSYKSFIGCSSMTFIVFLTVFLCFFFENQDLLFYFMAVR
jgi:hypothetical protein